MKQPKIDFNNIDDLWNELHLHLRKMVIPVDRYNDVNWLLRNMGVKNRSHPDFYRAEYLVRVIKKEIAKVVTKLNQTK